VFEVHREYTFEAAHRLTALPEGHKCGVKPSLPQLVRVVVKETCDSGTVYGPEGC
jgi:hypothetical protein